MSKTDFITLALLGQAPPLEPVTAETIYCTGGRIRWVYTGLTETVNTVAGTRDGSVFTYDTAAGALDAGLVYSVGYSVQTTSVTDIGTVTLRLRCKTTGVSAPFYLLTGSYDNTVFGQVVTPTVGTWVWYEFPLTEDPTTGLPWANAAAVAAKKWGFSFDSDVADGVDVFYCSEIELLIEQT